MSYNYRELQALKDVEADNNDNFYRDPNHLIAIDPELRDGLKDSKTLEYARFIRNKKYGIDVREAIARAIEYNSILHNKNVENYTNQNKRFQELSDEYKKVSDRIDAQISGSTSLSEVIDARQSIDGFNNETLKKRLDKIAENASEDDFVNNLVLDDSADVAGGVLEKFKADLNVFVEKIDTSKFTIGVGNDFHYDTESTYEFVGGSEESINHVQNLTFCSDKLNAIILNGDLTDSDDNVSFDTAKQFATSFAATAFSTSNTDTFILKGNHDAAGGRSATKVTSENSLSNKELAKIYGWDKSIYGETRGDCKSYFFKDYDDVKIRVIGLNSCDIPEEQKEDGILKYQPLNTIGYSQEQVTWLCEEALQLKDPSYHVIVFSHVPPIGVHGQIRNSYNRNGSCIVDILSAFKKGDTILYSEGEGDFLLNGKADFSSQGKGNLIGYFYGHVHKDHIEQVSDINFVSTTCSLANGESSKEEPRWTNWRDLSISDAFDVLEIDTAGRAVNIRRFGWKSEVERNIVY